MKSRKSKRLSGTGDVPPGSPTASVSAERRSSYHANLAEESGSATLSVNKENQQTDIDHATALKHALDEVSQLKKEISRLQAEVVFKDQVIKSLQHESNKFKPGLTCVICVEYMANPCTVACGHSFCYECLFDWMKIRKECPTCRDKIAQRPTLSFVVKEQVETFVDRLAEDEREIAKQRLRAKEDALKQKENPWNGMFLDPAIIDSEDGVRRCSRCSWEVVGRSCVNCGQRFTTDADESDTTSAYDMQSDDYDDEEDEAEDVGGLDYDRYDPNDSLNDDRTTDALSTDSFASDSDGIIEDIEHGITATDSDSSSSTIPTERDIVHSIRHMQNILDQEYRPQPPVQRLRQLSLDRVLPISQADAGYMRRAPSPSAASTDSLQLAESGYHDSEDDSEDNVNFRAIHGGDSTYSSSSGSDDDNEDESEDSDDDSSEDSVLGHARHIRSTDDDSDDDSESDSESDSDSDSPRDPGFRRTRILTTATIDNGGATDSDSNGSDASSTLSSDDSDSSPRRTAIASHSDSDTVPSFPSTSQRLRSSRRSDRNGTTTGQSSSGRNGHFDGWRGGRGHRVRGQA